MITTARLVIKPYEDKDEERMIALLTNDKIKETFMIPDFASKEQVVSLFKKLQASSLSKEHYEYGIYLNNLLIGFVNDVKIEGKKIELGYVIHPDVHNQGYASEVLAAVISDLFAKGYEEVIAGAFSDNIASRRVMEKCGMQLLDIEEEVEYRGKVHHAVYYSVTNDK